MSRYQDVIMMSRYNDVIPSCKMQCCPSKMLKEPQGSSLPQIILRITHLDERVVLNHICPCNIYYGWFWPTPINPTGVPCFFRDSSRDERLWFFSSWWKWMCTTRHCLRGQGHHHDQDNLSPCPHGRWSHSFSRTEQTQQIIEYL